jgi:broad specificity phosphatase PhoE
MMKEKFNTQIVFVRHGHRDKPMPDADNGLSEKGRNQVEDLVKEFKKGTLPKSRFFWTSPKKRCAETLKPLSDEAKAPLVIDELLDEQKSGESQTAFQRRIEKLIEKAEKLDAAVYLCSHGDLIPEAIELLAGKNVDVSKGQAIVLEKVNGKWKLL